MPRFPRTLPRLTAVLLLACTAFSAAHTAITPIGAIPDTTLPKAGAICQKNSVCAPPAKTNLR